MKNKKRIVILGCIVVLLAGIGYFVYSQVEISKTGTELTEYTPEAEITRRAVTTNDDSIIF